MSDLPMRLRRNCHFDDCQEAADEIERLQERVEYWRNEALAHNQQEEIERLKAPQRKLLNYCGQIIDLCYTLRRTPPGNRYGIAEGIIQLTQNIRHEVQHANTDDDSEHRRVVRRPKGPNHFIRD